MNESPRSHSSSKAAVLPEKQDITIQVVNASALPLTTFKKTPHPFVRISVDRFSDETEVTEDPTTSPCWIKTFRLSVVDCAPSGPTQAALWLSDAGRSTVYPTSVLSFQVFHRRRLFPDRALCRCALTIEDLLKLQGVATDIHLDLRSLQEKHNVLAAGRLTLRVNVINSVAAQPSTDAEVVDGQFGVPEFLATMDYVQTTNNAVVGAVRNVASATWTALEPLCGFLDLPAFAKLINALDELAKIHPFVNVGWTIIVSVYKVAKAEVDRDKKITRLISIITDVFTFAGAVDRVPKIEMYRDVINKLWKQTYECALFIQEYKGHGFARRALVGTISNADTKIEDFSFAFQALKESFDRATGIQVVLYTSRISQDTRRLMITDALKLPIPPNASARPRCLQGTRLPLLQFIMEWVTCPDNDKTTLWLWGHAGSGKSTIAATIADLLDEFSRLCDFIYFSRDTEDLRRPDLVIRRWANSLASFDARIAEVLDAALQKTTGITDHPLESQFTKLIVEPLCSIKSLQTEGPIVLVIDALDECGNVRERRSLLSILASQSRKLPPFVKVLITSRDEPDIRNAFHDQPHILEKLLDITDASTAADISKFFQHRFLEIRTGAYGWALPAQWPTPVDMTDLETRAAGLFIWASTVCNFVEGNKGVIDHQKNLKIILNKTSPDAESSIDKLYVAVLAHSYDSQDHDIEHDFKMVLSTTVSARTPLSSKAVAQLLDHMPRMSTLDVIMFVQPLGSLLSGTRDANALLRPLHPSFYDFLTDSKRSQHFYIDQKEHSAAMAKSCLEIIIHELNKDDICGVGDPFYLNKDISDVDVTQAMSEALRYACRFFVDHTIDVKPDDDLLEKIKRFLFQHLLHWIEALSLMKMLDVGFQSLRRLERWLREFNLGNTDLINLTYDGQRFLQAFSKPISEGASHVYTSALAFTPTNTHLFRVYGTRYTDRHPTIMLGKEHSWPVLISVLEGHRGRVKSVVFSPDGSRLASCSDDKTVRIWDAESGVPIGGPLEGHKDIIRSVVFSPDGSRLASCSLDKTVRIWNAGSGVPIGGPLEGHEDYVWSVVFSPDGSRLVSCSKDKTVRIWNAQSGVPIGGPLEGHEDDIRSVVFSPDGSRLASCSDDKTVRIWNAGSGVPIGGPLEGHEDYVWSVVFSPDGSRLASCSNDKTVRIWNAESGVSIGGPLEGHEGFISFVVFSPDGSRLVSCSSDKTIRIWNAESGVPIGGPLEGHEGHINSVVFSPDGSRLASCSKDKTVRIWNAGSGVPIGDPLEGHENHIWSVVFSPDGSRLASCSDDTTVRIWNAESGVPIDGPLEGHENDIRSVVFSPDGSRLASCSNDKTVRIWNAESGVPIGGLLEGHEDIIRSVVFSPDGSRLASCSDDKTVRIWNAESGVSIGGPLEGHEDIIRSVVFSPDSSRLASCSDDKTVRIWNAKSGVPIGGPLEGHEDYIWSVVFSLDGSRLASCSNDKTVRIWNAESGVSIGGPLEGHEGFISFVVFSPDGSRLASCSSDKTIRIWNAESGVPIGGPLEGHEDYIRSVVFSSNGSRLASCSFDKTVRIWNVESGVPIGGPLEGHEGHITSIVFSPDGSRLASCSDDKTIRIWNAKSCVPIGGPLEGHKDVIFSVVFSPDGSQLASCSNDNTVRIWDADDGNALVSLFGSLENLTTLLFSHTTWALSKSSHVDISLIEMAPHLNFPSAVTYDGWVVTPTGRQLWRPPVHFRNYIWEGPHSLVTSGRNSVALFNSKFLLARTP